MGQIDLNDEMSNFAQSYIMPYERVYFSKDLQTWSQKFLDIVLIWIIMVILISLFLYYFSVHENPDEYVIYLLMEVFFVLVLGLAVIAILWYNKSKPEIILTTKRLIYVKGKGSTKEINEVPYDKINAMNFSRTRKSSMIIIGVSIIVISIVILLVGLTTFDSDDIHTVIPIVFSIIMFFIGIIVTFMMGFSFMYVFKISGGNIEVPCIGRKNRDNSLVINTIVMDMREYGKWKHVEANKDNSPLPPPE